MSDTPNGNGSQGADLPRGRVAPIPSARPAAPRNNGQGVYAPSPLAEPPHTPREERARDAIRQAIAVPYTLDEWSADLQVLAGGVETGFAPLADVGLRWVAGKVYAVVARPGHGKTSFMLEAAARSVEASTDAVALFCSWEEPRAELVLRLFQRADACRQMSSEKKALVGVPIPKPVLRAWGRGGDEDVYDDTRERLEAVRPAVEALLQRLRIVEGHRLGRFVHPVLAAVGEWMRAEKVRPALVAVDYFQKLRAKGRYTSRQNELLEVSGTLLRFAGGEQIPAEVADDLGVSAGEDDQCWAVPVLVGAQVNRGDLAAGHPSGDNIREAEDLLNDAAAVLALSVERVAEGAPGDQREDVSSKLRVSVPKNRDGRARKDEVASIPWKPARSWLDTGATTDAQGGVQWSAYAPRASDAVATAPGRGSRRAGASRSLIVTDGDDE